MEWKLRHLQSPDYPSIQQLVKEVNSHDELTYSLSREWFDYVLQQAPHRVLTVFSGEELTGLGTLFDEEPAADRKSTINMVVRPRWRHQGQGSLLYKRLISDAVHYRRRTLQAVVKESLQDSLDFLQRRSFEVAQYAWEMEKELPKVRQDQSASQGGGSSLGVLLNTGKPPETPRLRPFTHSEAETYRRLFRDGFAYEPEAESFQMMWQDATVTPWVLLVDGEPVAMATVQVKEPLSKAYLYDIVVAKAFRGSGLGTALLEELLVQVGQLGVESASLLVAGSNENALRLYQKQGFSVTETQLVLEKQL
ncbi:MULTISPECIES: GNAT family N-acetyltransferase [Anoxynatronum]|uniref:Acetyltransferase (GNAT) family protein n=2 Tax=Anoxynatronum TaxID=210622 RepID=A0AA45WY57_9CLOT|nr:GNAT family N-acetyltransferase [Anoxynatronum buryatiense]SMP67461.1 Acetyltransferase (GNAT) family protein [Anoxynatronum buryatiense]